MPRSSADLLKQALSIVNQVGGGQTPSAEDNDTALVYLTALLAELRSREICEVYVYPADLSSEDIPDELFNPLAHVLALDLKTEFAGGMVSDDDREKAINRIRRVTGNKPTGEVQQGEYF